MYKLSFTILIKGGVIPALKVILLILVGNSNIKKSLAFHGK